jgi:ferric-dicitrate binding protein FerR (iron transport regulator)
MNLRSIHGWLAFGTALALVCVTARAHAEVKQIGEASVVVRSVQGILDAGPRPLSVSDPVFWQESIETGADSSARLTFLDDTVLSTGPGSQVKLDAFVYAGAAGTQKLVVSLSKGVMRFVSGKMDSDAYEVRTPGAIIGVRGTTFVVRVDRNRRTEILVERGRVRVRDADGGGEVTCDENQATFVAPPGKSEPPSEPGEPSPDLTQTGLELTVIQAINDIPAKAAPPGRMQELSSRKRLADSARAGGGASQTSSSCGGC